MILPVIPGYSIKDDDPAWGHLKPHLWIKKTDGPCEGEAMGIDREKFLSLGITTSAEMDEFWTREF